jgi:predicted kinase
MYTIIFDIDGTLSVIFPIAFLSKLVSGSANVICCTGRSEDYRKITEDWLRNHNIPFTRLYMRASGDERADHVVKSELLDQMYADGLNPILAIDDRSSVVAMWRNRGLVCLQCSDWDETKSLSGTTLDIIIGPYKAGKTAYTKRTYPAHRVLSINEFALDLQADEDLEDRYDDIVSSLRSVARTRINHALPTVMEAFNIRKKERTTAASLGLPNCKVRYHVLNRPMQDKLKECQSDAEEKLVRSTQESFTSQLRDILAGDGLAVEVLDLRGT